MGNENSYNAQELAALAIANPAKWAGIFMDSNNLTMNSGLYKLENDLFELEGLTLILVSSEGGSEGDGEQIERTYAIAKVGSKEDGGLVADALSYVEVTGSFDSYNGSEWNDDFYQVIPREVKVIKYFGV